MQDHPIDAPVPGEIVWIRRRPWRVKGAHAGSGLTRLEVEGRQPAESRTFLLPCDRWSHDARRGWRTVSSGRALAWLAGLAGRTHPAFTPGRIVLSKATLLAYQLEPALAALAGTRRILIADDVGLGKTIQASLIVAETLERRADGRVLVMAPSALLTQWCEELKTRFGVDARIADATHLARLRSDVRYLDNPWRSPGAWVASPDYLKQPHVSEALPRLPFDLVVIDEAHVVAGNSQRHAAADAIARAARQVLTLTATPHDGDDNRFRRLISIGATGSATDALLIFRRARTEKARHLRTFDVGPGPGLSRVLAAVDSFERAKRSGEPGVGLSPGRSLICGVFRKRALSSLAALSASLARRLAIVNASPDEAQGNDWTQPGFNFGDQSTDQGDVISSDEWSALRAVTDLSQSRERAWLERLTDIAGRIAPRAGIPDPKLARLVRLLQRTREPVVVFTEYRDSLLAIEAAIAGVRAVSILHGGMAGADQRRALRSFLGLEADVLLATDVASQGLNLQHRARWVIHFDLPWTPLRLEQRVGRVDRIGQTRTVHVTTLGIRHSAQQALRSRMIERQEATTAAALQTSTRWSAAAVALARLFSRQRELARCWRGPDPAAVLRARVNGPTMHRLCGLDAAVVSLIELPLVTDTGEVVERHFTWVRSAEASRAVVDDPPLKLVRRAAALSGRLRRRTRLDRTSNPAESSPPSQPGLFDVRSVPGLQSASRTLPVDEATIESVHVGRPHALLILERRT